jgi:hypothetical protein
MMSGTFTAILRCSDCGSRLVELRGPVADDAAVQCANCGGRVSPWAEFLSDLKARITCQGHERRGRRVRYRAKKHANPAPGWHLILSIPLDEFSLSFRDLSGSPSSVKGSRPLRHDVEVRRVQSRGGVLASSSPSAERNRQRQRREARGRRLRPHEAQPRVS